MQSQHRTTADVTTADVVVVGAGVIGAAIAWRCAQRRIAVVTVDPDPTRGAWHTAAGMLAPVTELQYTETPLLHLNLDSLRRWPAFAAELAAELGADERAVGLRRTGTVLVAWDAADLAALRDLHAFGQRFDIASILIGGRDLRGLEPALAAGLPGGLHAPDDHQVDPRLLRDALARAGRRRGVRHVTAEVTRVRTTGDRVEGVDLADGTTLAAPVVVLAAGAWSGTLAGPPPGAVPAVRPVKGQTLRLRLPGTPVLNHVVRGRVKGNPIYLVPRADGRIVVGASTEEAGFDRSARAGAVYELLRDAQSLLPELGEAELAEISTGLRPGSPDNAPLVGASGALGGLVVATGHYRNGVLLTPVTADGVAALLADGALPDVLHPFAPDRFERIPA
ncbi:glycine oxidase [Jatrophihabitans endophyticus]|uniref:glycine oxidase n=1 Tax=Jatrophihabitans endophyticus TaxID=1206085 RepID=A0A1M5C753_9ACTN|nr:glycine oxidase ThiO [Jatrophihabitans endophyticus]SHF50573.1 glycine oxidase [Jatrophihabitans endophyticus]